jgi:hypothetical protein
MQQLSRDRSRLYGFSCASVVRNPDACDHTVRYRTPVDDEDVRSIVAAAYNRLQESILSASTTATVSPRIHEIIVKTLNRLQDRLNNDPQFLDEIIQATQRRQNV